MVHEEAQKIESMTFLGNPSIYGVENVMGDCEWRSTCVRPFRPCSSAAWRGSGPEAWPSGELVHPRHDLRDQENLMDVSNPAAEDSRRVRSEMERRDHDDELPDGAFAYVKDLE